MPAGDPGVRSTSSACAVGAMSITTRSCSSSNSRMPKVAKISSTPGGTTSSSANRNLRSRLRSTWTPRSSPVMAWSSRARSSPAHCLELGDGVELCRPQLAVAQHRTQRAPDLRCKHVIQRRRGIDRADTHAIARRNLAVTVRQRRRDRGLPYSAFSQRQRQRRRQRRPVSRFEPGAARLSQVSHGSTWPIAYLEIRALQIAATPPLPESDNPDLRPRITPHRENAFG